MWSLNANTVLFCHVNDRLWDVFCTPRQFYHMVVYYAVVLLGMKGGLSTICDKSHYVVDNIDVSQLTVTCRGEISAHALNVDRWLRTCGRFYVWMDGLGRSLFSEFLRPSPREGVTRCKLENFARSAIIAERLNNISNRR